MKTNNRYVAGALVLAMAVLVQAAATAKPASIRPNIVSCRVIKTAAQLSRIRNDLSADYCLANDINLASITNFIPIGDDATPYTGHFFGNNHVIRNLRINDSAHTRVGLFGTVQGTIEDVSLVNVNVNSTAFLDFTGGVAGKTTSSSLVRNVGVSGRVRCSGSSCLAGGVVGDAEGPVSTSWSSADVTGTIQIGGLVGFYDDVVSDSFATGRVTCTSGSCVGGGLLGAGNGTVARSFATGPVSGPDNSQLGGLAGKNVAGASQSFATGSVSGGNSSTVGGLFGAVFNPGTIVDQCYAAGRVSGGTGATLAGLIATMNTGPVITNSYWDTETTGQAASVAGTPKTTAELRAALPTGFGPRTWAINKRLSFPFLNEAEIDFTGPLATLVRANKVFTFLPISQLDLSQYRFNPAHEANASLAAVYTMIARAIGNTDEVAQLQNVKIDRYFWHDPRQTTTFTGPVTAHATLGVLKPLAANTKLTRANVIGKLNAQRLVILRGTYARRNGTRATHWMLATLYTRGPGRIVNAVVANDPWTGLQVAIDPASKTVISPANFPLSDFKVNGYRAVAVH